MDVSIIYVNYHTSGLIADSLRSVIALTRGVEYEVIIVDNHSESDLPDRFNRLFPELHIRYVMLQDNIGFGRANNEGFKLAQGRNLFCLNPDTVLLNNALRILSGYLDDNPGTGIVGGNLLDADMKPALSFRRILPGIRWEMNELLHMHPEKLAFGRDSRFNHTDRPSEVGYISGADLMIRADLASSVGGFNPEFFMYFEETDLCLRVRKAGYSIVNVPQASIQHIEGGSYVESGFNPCRLERNERSRLTYYRLNSPPVRTTVANLIYGSFLLSRAILKHSRAYRHRLKLLIRIMLSKQ